MSKFSGKCDLYDHICGLGGWYDKEGHSVQMGDANVGVYYSDEMKDFEAFKKRTGGVIYQHFKIDKISELNHDFVKEHCNGFDYEKNVKQNPDKRTKTGIREITEYTYTYHGIKIEPDEGFWVELEIKFNDILDIIKYYPYIVSMLAYVDGKEKIVIGSESFVDTEFKEGLQYGHSSVMKSFYDRRLQEHYLEIKEKYLDYKLKERTCAEKIKKRKPREDGYYEIALKHKIDYNHPIEYVWKDNKSHAIWSQPKFLKDNIILISNKDMEKYSFGKEFKIKYVKYPKKGFPISLC